MDASKIPGATGQPDEPLQGPSMETMQWVHTTSPKVDYAEGNPGQDTSPAPSHALSNDSERRATPQSANDLNGGRDLFQGGGTG